MPIRLRSARRAAFAAALMFITGPAPAAEAAPGVEGLDGDWQGTISVGAAGHMRLIFHVHTGSDGGVMPTYDSPDQGMAGAPLSAVRRHGREVEFEFGANHILVVGDLSDDNSGIQGEFEAGELIIPLVLKRGGDLPPAISPASSAEAPKTWRYRTTRRCAKFWLRRIDTERRGVGIVVGMISPAGRRVVAYGAPDVGDPRRVDGETVFEIGSISKTFTALVLQDMALKGEVGLDDPVSKYLPPGTKVPSHGGKAITLRQLATHTSGLPRDLPNPKAKRLEEAYDNADRGWALRLSATYQLTRDPGAEWDYSNWASGSWASRSVIAREPTSTP